MYKPQEKGKGKWKQERGWGSRRLSSFGRHFVVKCHGQRSSCSVTYWVGYNCKWKYLQGQELSISTRNNKLEKCLYQLQLLWSPHNKTKHARDFHKKWQTRIYIFLSFFFLFSKHFLMMVEQNVTRYTTINIVWNQNKKTFKCRKKNELMP